MTDSTGEAETEADEDVSLADSVPDLDWELVWLFEQSKYRRGIAESIRDGKNTIGEISDRVGIEKYKVKRHIQRLQDNGGVDVTDGATPLVRYELPEDAEEALEYANNRREKWS